MKKLLSFFGCLSLGTLSSSIIVSCNKNETISFKNFVQEKLQNLANNNLFVDEKDLIQVIENNFNNFIEFKKIECLDNCYSIETNLKKYKVIFQEIKKDNSEEDKILEFIEYFKFVDKPIMDVEEDTDTKIKMYENEQKIIKIKVYKQFKNSLYCPNEVTSLYTVELKEDQDDENAILLYVKSYNNKGKSDFLIKYNDNIYKKFEIEVKEKKEIIFNAEKREEVENLIKKNVDEKLTETKAFKNIRNAQTELKNIQ